MNTALVDLHIHTSASDGTYSPAEIVHLAQENGLRAIAITDHDTVAGNEEAMQAGLEVGLEVIPGVEISVEWNKCPIHILGYYVDKQGDKLALELESLVRYREERNQKIVEKLISLGLEISYEEVKLRGGRGTIGRPHFAQVLVKKGYAKDEDHAFRKYLKKGAIGYVEKKRLSPQQGIDLIKAAGGIPILAHPFIIDGIEKHGMEQFVLQFKYFGIQGVEVFYPMHTKSQISTLKAIVSKHHLLMTGGSDFHGGTTTFVSPGKDAGHRRIRYALVEGLKARLATA